MTSRSRLSATDRKTAIVMSAMKVFARKGFAGATTREIAAEAGVSEALLYKHFSTKEAMYSELASSIGANGERFARLITSAPAGSFGFVRSFYYLGRFMLIGHPGAPKDHSIDRLMGYSLLEDGSFARAFLESLFYRMMPYLEECLRASEATGELTLDVASGSFECVLFHHFLGTIALFSLPSEPVLPPMEPMRLLQLALSFGLRGLGFTEQALERHLDFDRLDQEFNLTLTKGTNNEPSENHS